MRTRTINHREHRGHRDSTERKRKQAERKGRLTERTMRAGD
jgi:hypothetical protein